MDTSTGLIAIVPARGGANGSPGKNLRTFAGLPLIAHSILLAKNCMEVEKVIVSTDSSDVAEVAAQYGADVSLLRPAELSMDEAPLWAVLRQALASVERHGETYRWVLLLDPAAPCRTPLHVMEAFQRLLIDGDADGIIGVSKAEVGPHPNAVVEKDGWMEDAFPGATNVFRINDALRVWRAEFMREHADTWRKGGRYLLYEMPDALSMSIDTPERFARAELFVNNHPVDFPWLEQNEAHS